MQEQIIWHKDKTSCPYGDMWKKQNPYSCGICTKAFWSKRYLNEHVKLHKEGNIDEEIIIPCSWPGCSKTYKSRIAMLNHYKDKYKMSSLPARVEATSTTTSPNQCEPPVLPS